MSPSVALEENNIVNDIRDSLSSMQTQMATVVTRTENILGQLEKLNGRVGRAEENIRDLEQNEAEMRGERGAVKVIWGLFLVLTGGIVGATVAAVLRLVIK